MYSKGVEEVLDVVKKAQEKANSSGTPQCIVAVPSGMLQIVPKNQSKRTPLETVWPVTGVGTHD